MAALVSRAHDSGIRAYELGPGIMERVADAVAPQAVCAVVGSVDVSLDVLLSAGHRPAAAAGGTDLGGELPGGAAGGARPGGPVGGGRPGAGAAPGLVAVCVDVRDPGNLGAVLRSAGAAGASGVVCCSGAVDPYNPKAVRASAGSLFHVPLVVDIPVGEVLVALSEAGYRRWATVAHGGIDYGVAALEGPTALLFGNEAAGLADELVSQADGSLTIPMAGPTESLNVAMAAAVLCFEVARRRRLGARSPGSGSRRG